MPTLQRMQWSTRCRHKRHVENRLDYIGERKAANSCPDRHECVNVYGAGEQFITRIDRKSDVDFMNRVIIAALKRIAAGDTGMEDDDGQIIVRRPHEDAEGTSSEEVEEAVAPV